MFTLLNGSSIHVWLELFNYAFPDVCYLPHVYLCRLSIAHCVFYCCFLYLLATGFITKILCICVSGMSVQWFAHSVRLDHNVVTLYRVTNPQDTQPHWICEFLLALPPKPLWWSIVHSTVNAIVYIIFSTRLVFIWKCSLKYSSAHF